MCLFVLIGHSTKQQVASASGKAHLDLMRYVYVNVLFRCSNTSGTKVLGAVSSSSIESKLLMSSLL
jgi:hypothetical protein